MFPWYKVPVFNITANVWNPPAAHPAAPSLVTPCQMRYPGRKPWALSQPLPPEWAVPWSVLFPKLTDIRDSNSLGGNSTVEVPAGSGRFYRVAQFDDVGKGFPNDHRLAYVVKLATAPLNPIVFGMNCGLLLISGVGLVPSLDGSVLTQWTDQSIYGTSVLSYTGGTPGGPLKESFGVSFKDYMIDWLLSTPFSARQLRYDTPWCFMYCGFSSSSDSLVPIWTEDDMASPQGWVRVDPYSTFSTGDPTGTFTLTADTVVNPNEFFTWLLYYDGSGYGNPTALRLFLNGVEITYTTNTVGGVPTPILSTNIFLGGDNYASSHFDGDTYTMSILTNQLLTDIQISGLCAWLATFA